MPDRESQIIEHLIYYQYAKIITKSAMGVPDGKAAKAGHYGFIKNTLRELKEGSKKWSDITREDWQFVQNERVCTTVAQPTNSRRSILFRGQFE